MAMNNCESNNCKKKDVHKNLHCERWCLKCKNLMRSFLRQLLYVNKRLKVSPDLYIISSRHKIFSVLLVKSKHVIFNLEIYWLIQSSFPVEQRGSLFLLVEKLLRWFPTKKCTFQVWSRQTPCMLGFCFWVFFCHLGNSRFTYLVRQVNKELDKARR